VGHPRSPASSVGTHPKGMCNRRKHHSTPTPGFQSSYPYATFFTNSKYRWHRLSPQLAVSENPVWLAGPSEILICHPRQ